MGIVGVYLGATSLVIKTTSYRMLRHIASDRTCRKGSSNEAGTRTLEAEYGISERIFVSRKECQKGMCRVSSE